MTPMQFSKLAKLGQYESMAGDEVDDDTLKQRNHWMAKKETAFCSIFTARRKHRQASISHLAIGERCYTYVFYIRFNGCRGNRVYIWSPILRGGIYICTLQERDREFVVFYRPGLDGFLDMSD